jgi:hypothetical protein
MSENQTRSMRPFGQRTGSSIVLNHASLRVSPLYPARQSVMLAGITLGILIALIWRLLHAATFHIRGGSQEHVLPLKAEAVRRTSLAALVTDPGLTLYHNQLRTMPLVDVLQLMRLYASAAPQDFVTPVVMDVLDNASLPAKPVKPNRLNIALTGGITGLIAAAIIAIVRRRWKPKPIFRLTPSTNRAI